jgi:hypothetical protein
MPRPRTPYWFFRYWADELGADGKIKTSRKRRIVEPSKGSDAITRKQAEIERDQFLANLNAAPSACQAAVQATKPADIGAILFGKLAEMWRDDFVERKIGAGALLAAPTRAKYIAKS